MSRALVGSSGWAYPSWRPGFYPAGARPDDFLRLYAERLPAVELNATGYRLPAAAQFARWADQVPAGFRFAVKAPRFALQRPEPLFERVAALGDRLGCVRVVLERAPADESVERLLDAAGGTRVALDVRDPSWAVDGLPRTAVRVGDLGAAGGWAYLRYREPPYTDAALARIAAEIRGLLARGAEAFAFFRHEREPTAAAAALRVLVLLEP